MAFTIEDISEADRRDLLERVMNPCAGENKERRDEFRWRMMAMLEQHQPLVDKLVEDRFHLTAVILEIKRYTRSLFNPLRRILRKLAVAYKHPPTRFLHGRSQDLNDTFTELLRRVRCNQRARRWNEHQVALNTACVLLRPRKSVDGDPIPDFFIVHGADGEVVLDPERPFPAAPGILAYPLPQAKGSFDLSQPMVMTVDSRWYIVWDGRQNPLEAIEHGFGRFPGSVLRNTEPLVETRDGWWDPAEGRGVTETIAEVGLAAATMAWTRKTQFSHLITILRGGTGAPQGDETEGDGGQVIGHPESVLELDGENVRVVVNDIDKGIQNFREHMDFLLHEAAEVMTGAGSVLVEPQAGQGGADILHTTTHAALRERQEDQIEGLRLFETDFLPLVADLATRIRCPWAVPADVVRETLRLGFSPLPFLDTPENRLRFYMLATKFGVADQVDYMVETKDVSQDEAEELIHAKAERRAELHELLSIHQTPADGDTDESIPDPSMPGERKEAQQGRRGGVSTRPEAPPA